MSLSFQGLVTQDTALAVTLNFHLPTSLPFQLIPKHNEVRSAVRMSWPKSGGKCLEKKQPPQVQISSPGPGHFFQRQTETKPPFTSPYHGKSWGQCPVPWDNTIEKLQLLVCLKPQLYSRWYLKYMLDDSREVWADNWNTQEQLGFHS